MPVTTRADKGTALSHVEMDANFVGLETAADAAAAALAILAARPSDAELRDRTTHTGEQDQNTITGLTAALLATLKTDAVGTAPFQIVALDSLGRLPMVNGSQLTDLPGSGTGGGDVSGPAVSVDGRAAIFSGTSGKVIAQSTAAPVLEGDARLTNARTPVSHGHPIAEVAELQATLDGKQPAGSYAVTGHGHADATTSLAGFMAAADKTKLNGVAAGATALSIGTTGTTAAAGNHGHADATTALAGFLSAAGKIRVDAALLRTTGQNQPLVADFHAPGTLADGAFRWEAATTLNPPLTTGGGAAILIWRATGVGVWIAWETGGSLGSNVPEFYLKTTSGQAGDWGAWVTGLTAANLFTTLIAGTPANGDIFEWDAGLGRMVPVTPVIFTPDPNSSIFYDIDSAPLSESTAAQRTRLEALHMAVPGNAGDTLQVSVTGERGMTAVTPTDFPVATSADFVAGALAKFPDTAAIRAVNTFVSAPPVAGVINLSTAAAAFSYSSQLAAATTVAAASFNPITQDQVVRLWITNDATGREITFEASIKRVGHPTTFAVANRTDMFLLMRGPAAQLVAVWAGSFV